MDRKLSLALFVLLAVVVMAQADFWYNHVQPKPEQVSERKLLCVPGRTVLKVKTQNLFSADDVDEDPTDDEEATLRSHMNEKTQDESCRICVCSVNGEDEYCSNRQARNINECMRMAMLNEEFQKAGAFEHEKVLSYMIRRDYLWHNDEIPYDKNAKCTRGHSFYSNNPAANNTTIDQGDEDVQTNLDYEDKGICFYCICDVTGQNIVCINRHAWYCDVYRASRDPVKMRDRYRILFQQDRPAYFRSLSFRMRRTMDSGIYALIENANKEDKPKKCVPFVSEYTDCTDDNLCSGCTRCTCTAAGEWSCSKVVDCKGAASDVAPVNEASLDDALNVLYSELKSRDKESVKAIPAPITSTNKEDLLLDKDDEIEQKIIALMSRRKRSIEHKSKKDSKSIANGTVKFHHTVDELNEDTLKNSSESGMINAIKIDGELQKIGRRTGMLLHNNLSNPLHIEYSHPQKFDHITDNKIDEATTIDTIADSHIQEKFNLSILPKEKDKELSKIVVNELKPGTEIVGNPESPIMSNITFTPENDTLTAMAFIAGNLLNKLWSMEKATEDTSAETEDIKHEKISDLLELFKEPLSLRQEAFLKDALERLSGAIDKHKDISNVSLCETIEGAKQFLKDTANGTLEKNEGPASSDDDSIKFLDVSPKKTEVKDTPKVVKNATAEAIEKINNVLNLMKKFENVNSNLENLKIQTTKEAKPNLRNTNEFENNFTNKDGDDNLNLFGKVLEKITKLLLPSKNSRRFANKIRSHSIFGVSSDIKKKFKNTYNLDLGSMNLTEKDKIILDYITKVNSNPRCLLDAPQNAEFPAIEGGILLNLLEFFKIRSFVDLVKLIQPEKKVEKKEPFFRTKTDSDPNEMKINTTSQLMTETTMQPSTVKVATERSNTKDKLKAHLKTILEDLIELQKETGIPTKEGQIKIADVLPCIYNILNSNDEIKYKAFKNNENTVANTSPAERIAALFEAVKKEVVIPSRRNLIAEEQRPKSATLWERIVKNFDPVRIKQTRRTLDVVSPKTFSELEKMMKEVQTINTSTYKNYGSYLDVHPSERLGLLKKLENDVKKYVEVLKHIKISMDTLTNLDYDTVKKITEFTANVTANLKLDEMIMKTLTLTGESKPKKIRQMTPRPQEYEYKQKVRKMTMLKQETMIRPSIDKSNVNAVKYTRDEILNQLIKNRMQAYLRLKETTSVNPNDDINYGIAKNVIINLEKENYHLARELYKVFVATKHQESRRRTNNEQVIAPQPKSQDTNRGLFDKMPVSQFEHSKPLVPAVAHQDQMLKQLLNMKNLRM